MRKAIFAVGITAALSACSTASPDQVREALDVSVMTAWTPPPTTSRPVTTTPPVTAAPWTPPPTYEPVMGSMEEYDRNLEYLTDYCWSNCDRMYTNRWENYLDKSSEYGLDTAVKVLAEYAYWELDDKCDDFWDRTDEWYRHPEMKDDDFNAFMATMYYTCDS